MDLAVGVEDATKSEPCTTTASHPRRCATPTPILPSPDRSPEPIAAAANLSVIDAPQRLRSPNPDAGTIRRSRSRECRNDRENDANKGTETAPLEMNLEDHPTDIVSLDLARVVVNLHEFYKTELDAEKERNSELQAQQERMQRKMEDMDRRLQTHVVLMEGFVSFMMQVKEGKFGVTEMITHPEIEIAQNLGQEHLEVVQGLMEEKTFVAMPGTQDEEVPTVEEMLEATQQSEDEGGYPQEAETRGDFNQLPPTPDMDTAPLRSTGMRAPKRRDPFAKTHHAKRRAVASRGRAARAVDEALSDLEYCPSKRQFRFRSLELRSRQADEQRDGHLSDTDPHSVELRPRRRTGWTAVNVPPSPADEESVAGDFESEYDPESDKEANDIPSTATSSRSASPAPSTTTTLSSLSTPPPNPPNPPISLSSSTTSKPRYSAPRRTGHRYASGPTPRRFRFHRMPKTVALIWQEWKHGLHGNPSIESLEREFGTGWRGGTLAERKYASNYVGVRQKIVRKVEEMCEADGIGEVEACAVLDRRVDGRIQLLLAAIKEGGELLEVIPRRGG